MDSSRLRPHPYVLTRGVAAILAFFVPALGVLYFLTIPNGPWGLVVVGTVLVLAMFCYSLFSYSRLGVWVTPETVAERGFFGITKRYTADQLGPTVMLNMYHGGAPDTMPQLFICDPDGRQLIRLRGQFWPLSVMQTVASTLEVPLTEIERPVSKSELHAKYPGLLYWFERRPVVAALIFAGILVVSGALIYLIMLLAGVRMN